MFQERLFRPARVVRDMPLKFLPHVSFFRISARQDLIDNRGCLPAQRLQIRVRSAEVAGPGPNSAVFGVAEAGEL
jgi:hypothetical protein